MDKLSSEQIEARLTDHSAWSENNGAIQRTYQHRDFVESMKFVTGLREKSTAIATLRIERTSSWMVFSNSSVNWNLNSHLNFNLR